MRKSTERQSNRVKSSERSGLAVRANYRELRYPDGKIAAKVDVTRGIIEIQNRGTVHTWDLLRLTQEG